MATGSRNIHPNHIVTVNVGVRVLDVDNQGVDHREQRLDVGNRNIERGFKIDLPALTLEQLGFTRFDLFTYQIRKH